jgi:hypothetical protein
LKLWFGWPSSRRSPIRVIVSLRIEATAKMVTPTLGSLNGRESRAVMKPVSLPMPLLVKKASWCR